MAYLAPVTAVELDFRDAVQVVRPRKQPRRTEAGGTCDYTLGNDGDPVAVVVEGDLIEQRRTDGIGGVNHAAVRGVAERVPTVGTLSPLHMDVP